MFVPPPFSSAGWVAAGQRSKTKRRTKFACVLAAAAAAGAAELWLDTGLSLAQGKLLLSQRAARVGRVPVRGLTRPLPCPRHPQRWIGATEVPQLKRRVQKNWRSDCTTRGARCNPRQRRPTFLSIQLAPPPDLDGALPSTTQACTGTKPASLAMHSTRTSTSTNSLTPRPRGRLSLCKQSREGCRCRKAYVQWADRPQEQGPGVTFPESTP